MDIFRKDITGRSHDKQISILSGQKKFPSDSKLYGCHLILMHHGVDPIQYVNGGISVTDSDCMSNCLGLFYT